MSIQSECPIVRSWFDACFDGTLSRSRKRLLRRHLSECGNCLREFGTERNIIASLRNLPSPACPESVERRIVERLGMGRMRDREKAFRKILPRIPVWEWISAGAAVVVVVVLVVSITKRPLQTPSVSARYDEEQIRTASKQARWSLSYAIGVIQKTEKNIIRDVLLDKFPESLRNILEKSIPLMGGKKP